MLFSRKQNSHHSRSGESSVWIAGIGDLPQTTSISSHNDRAIRIEIESTDGGYAIGPYDRVPARSSVSGLDQSGRIRADDNMIVVVRIERNYMWLHANASISPAKIKYETILRRHKSRQTGVSDPILPSIIAVHHGCQINIWRYQTAWVRMAYAEHDRAADTPDAIAEGGKLIDRLLQSGEPLG
jgi:hypothetical protein